MSRIAPGISSPSSLLDVQSNISPCAPELLKRWSWTNRAWKHRGALCCDGKLLLQDLVGKQNILDRISNLLRRRAGLLFRLVCVLP